MTNTQPARGMRDFLPADIRKRNYVIKIIKEVYEKYGFEPLETPSVENLETLTGKYGEEGSQLMFKILKRGEKLQQELAEGKIKSENELLRSRLALRLNSSAGACRRQLQKRTAEIFQTLPNPTRLARRPSGKRQIQRILPMRR